MRWALALGSFLWLLLPATAAAQSTSEDPAAEARLRVGPVALTPRLAIRNVGVDSNVLNAADEPQRDFTGAVVPGADSWLQIGRARFSSKTSLEWTYFHKTTSQRALNLSEEGRIDLDLIRLVPYVTGQYIRTRQRPNLEIDERVQQKVTGGGFGLVLFPDARLRLEAGLERRRFDFGTTKFGSAALAEVLNRESNEGAVSMRYEVTPLTSLTMTASARYDEFEFAPLRDSNAIGLVSGLEFEPFALVSGSARVGVRRFRTVDAALPDYTGLVASVDLKYVARDLTRVVYEATRDVEYSFEPSQPFFVSSDQRVELTQVLGYWWDLRVRGSLGRLTYHDLVGAQPAAGRRVDRVVGYGVGIGRRLGDSLRIGIDADHARRSSSRQERSFEGFRFGGSVTYGS